MGAVSFGPKLRIDPGCITLERIDVAAGGARAVRG